MVITGYEECLFFEQNKTKSYANNIIKLTYRTDDLKVTYVIFFKMILLVGGEKGGTGKSAIACNLAAVLAIKQCDVMLVDADRQGTASKWINRRNKTHPELPKINCVQKTGHVFESVRDLATRYDELIIDAGGRDSEELRTALVTSHKLLTPLKPAQDNIETMSRMVNRPRPLIESLKPMSS